jgi:tRNA pseudouridine55 synthase
VTTAGFVLADKPAGPTSHDVVDMVRKALHIKRVGHAGTLDPAASGLLVIAVGGATRLLSYVQDLPKTYETTGTLGVRTTTLDAAGDVSSRADVHASGDDIRAAAAGLVGEIRQVPPAYSAVKVGGERAYRKARRGEVLDLEPRTVTVHTFDILRTSASAFDARITCSSGTYVRSLVAEVGERLGCGAHVAHLRRTAIGHLHVSDAVLPEAISPRCVRCVEDVLTHLGRIDVDAETASRAANGRTFEADAPDGVVVVCGPAGAVGVFEATDGMLRPRTVLGG